MLDIIKIFEDLLIKDAITFTKGEVSMAKFLYNLFLQIPYFEENPENIKLIPTDEDDLLRFNQVAILEKGSSNDAILIINPLDEPAISDRLNGLDIMSLKATTACLYKVMENLANTLEKGKVILVNVCDRFGEHEGIKSCVKYIRDLKKNGINFKAVIHTSSYLSTGEESVFFGSQANLRPSIFVAGKIAKTESFYDGVDPGYIISTIVRDMTLNSELMEFYQNEVSEPIYVNRMIVPGGTDYQSATFGYVSFITTYVSSSVLTFLNNFKRVIFNSVKKSFDEMNTKYAKYCLKRDIKYNELRNIPKVYTWDEFYNEIATVRGDIVTSSIKNKIRELKSREEPISKNELRLRIVRYLYDNFKLANEPVIVIYLEDYPLNRLDVTGTTKAQRDLMFAVTSSINKIDPKIKRRFFFPELSYSSYFDITDDLRDIKMAKYFVPDDSKEYSERVNLSEELSIPSVTMGGITKLVNGEYVFDEKYHFEKLPSLITETIKKLLEE